MFVTGRIVPLLLSLMILFLISLRVKLYPKFKVPAVRSIPALDAIKEGVGRAIETGRPVHFMSGAKGSQNIYTGHSAPHMLASMSLLRETAKWCARLDAKLLTTFGKIDMIPLAETAISESFMLESQSERYDREDIKFFPELSLAIGTVARMQSENIGTNIIAGGIWLEGIIIGAEARDLGAFQIALVTTGARYLVPVCDYIALYEELYVASALVSEDPLQICSIQGQDWSKLVSLALMIVGVIATNLGITALNKLLGL